MPAVQITPSTNPISVVAQGGGTFGRGRGTTTARNPRGVFSGSEKRSGFGAGSEGAEGTGSRRSGPLGGGSVSIETRPISCGSSVVRSTRGAEGDGTGGSGRRRRSGASASAPLEGVSLGSSAGSAATAGAICAASAGLTSSSAESAIGSAISGLVALMSISGLVAPTSSSGLVSSAVASADDASGDNATGEGTFGASDSWLAGFARSALDGAAAFAGLRGLATRSIGRDGSGGRLPSGSVGFGGAIRRDTSGTLPSGVGGRSDQTPFTSLRPDSSEPSFDEPSAGLDPVVSAELDELILRLKGAMDVSIVVVTHELESAFKIADRITVLGGGHILMTGTPEEVQNSDNQDIQDMLNRKPRDETVNAEEYLARLTAARAHQGI